MVTQRVLQLIKECESGSNFNKYKFADLLVLECMDLVKGYYKPYSLGSAADYLASCFEIQRNKK